MAVRERFITEYSVESMDAVDRFALDRGMNRIDAIQHLIALGDYVANNLAEGKQFLIKDGADVSYVD